MIQDRPTDDLVRLVAAGGGIDMDMTVRPVEDLIRIATAAATFAELRYVRLQQDAGLRQQLGGMLAFADQLVELGAFLRAQPHCVLLGGNLFPDHESPPSLPCGEGDPEVAVIFYDGSDYTIDSMKVVITGGFISNLGLLYRSRVWQRGGVRLNCRSEMRIRRN